MSKELLDKKGLQELWDRIELKYGKIENTTRSAIASTILDAGKPVWLTDEKRLVIGDGSTIGANLPYILTEDDIEEVHDFATDDWATISKISEEGNASKYYNIGDTRTVDWNGKSVKIRIVSFYHFDKTDKSGKAGIVCQTVNCLPSSYYMIDSSTKGNDGYGSTDFYTTYAQEILDGFEEDLQAVIKEVNIRCNKGYNNSGQGVTTLPASLFLPSLAEIYSDVGLTTNCSISSTNSYWDYVETGILPEGTQFEFYRDKTGVGDLNGYSACPGAVKYNGDDSTSTTYYWTRTPRACDFGDWWRVGSTGDFYSYDADDGDWVAPCFCI